MYNTIRNLGLERKQGKINKKFWKNNNKAIRVHGFPLVPKEALDIIKHPLWVQHPNIMLIVFYVVM